MVKLTGTKKMDACEIAMMVSEMNDRVDYCPHNPFSDDFDCGVILTDSNPADFVYPQGWCYDSGFLRKKHSTVGGIPFMRRNGHFW